MPLLAFFFVLSGAAGLIYESVWARYVGLLVGHSAYAQSIVLVIFLGGLAIGSLVTARVSQRIRAPLLWYCLVEAAVGLVAAHFHDAFVGVTHLAYERWLPSMSAGAQATATMWTIAALLILPQSILLGATFPLMTAGALRYRVGHTGGSLGLLYFANSFGASAGALVEGFFLIGAVGLAGTLRVAAWLNVFVAVGVLVTFVRPSQVFRSDPVDPSDDFSDRSRGGEIPVTIGPSVLRRALLAVSFVTAFSSFFYEIAWTRMLSLVHGSATHSFELMLSAFVLGLALGALWISRRADRTAAPLVLLARLHWAMGIAAIATLPLYVLTFDWTAALLSTLRSTDGAYRMYSVARYGMTLSIMLPATFCAGATLPLITRTLLASGSGEEAIGLVYGVNTIGSIVGAATAALLLIPLIGLKWVLIAGGMIDIGVGIALLVWIDRASGVPVARHRNLWAAFALTAAGLLAIISLSPFSPHRLASGVYRYARVPAPDQDRYLFYRDGRTASVSVRQERADSNGLLTIATNGKPDASVSPRWLRPNRDTSARMLLDEDMSTQILLPVLALAYEPGARIGAVIGQGSGITSHVLLASPTLTRLHTIEIEPEMIRGSRQFYPGNRRVFDDPRSRFENDDARAFLASTGPRFDVVVSEPSNPWVSGVSSLFTIEFYQRVRTRLQPTGILVQWFHLYETDDGTVASVLASIDRVFPSYRVYLSSNSDLVIIAGASDTLPSADWRVLSAPALATDLRRFVPLRPETFEAAEIGGRAALHGYLLHAAVNSDFRPLLDLNGERLRFRKDFATGFRELAEMRLDIPAALEHRRRGFGPLLVNPTPEIFRARALERGALLRAARDNPAISASWSDNSLRRAAAELRQFTHDLAGSDAPVSWPAWLARFVSAEASIHDGTAGVAEARFYTAVRAYVTAMNAPAPVAEAVNFYRGLAAWDYAEAAESGDRLLAELRAGHGWVPFTTLRLGSALAKIELGDLPGARAVYATSAPFVRRWTLADQVIGGVIEQLTATRRKQR